MESSSKPDNEVVDAVVNEESPKNEVVNAVIKEPVPEKEAIDSVSKKDVSEKPEKEGVLVESSNLEAKIVKQLEYYFSDINLPYDKFLQNEIKADDGWVKISVLLTFKRLASISKDPAVIAAAVKNCTHSILEIDETNEKIRRKLDTSIPVADQKFLNELIERSIYCKGFPKTATMDDLLNFAASFGDQVITKVTPRRLKNKEFKGTLYLTFSTKEQAEDFLKRESVKYNDVELKRMWQKDFFEEKKKEYETKVARKDEKIKAETEKYFKKGYLFKADNLTDTVTVDSIKTVCAGFEWQVAFVKIVENQKIAWIRLKPVEAAKVLLEEIADKKNDLNINFSIPDEETEQTVLNEMTKEMKGVLHMKDRMKREKNKNKGGKRYNNKRRNDDDHSNNKRMKTMCK